MNESEKDSPHYIYVLMYPEDYPDEQHACSVFYVGKGSGKRIFDHEREARRGIQSYKCNVIRKIWAANCQVVKTILAYFEAHEEALQYEIALIFFMGGLTNKTYGGEGTVGLVHTEEECRRRSESKKGKPPVWIFTARCFTNFVGMSRCGIAS